MDYLRDPPSIYARSFAVIRAEADLSAEDHAVLGLTRSSLAVWLPLFNPKQTDLVSRRVGNYRWSPHLRLMPSLLWVK
jgi:precorrin isomerase